MSLRRYGVATSPTRVRQKRQIASGSRTVANAAALSAPTLVPEIARTRRASPSSHIAFQTPAWKAPFAPPPDRTSPMSPSFRMPGILPHRRPRANPPKIPLDSINRNT